ncbi:cadherin-23-like [Acanthaster planci]|uniref:Cadherin-23-like n=1 Tax=Acanthaster planci TaxID=133434 RepID=A0A8B8A210_ACAPL|nr:cadherin-23-like [Acanthaster planci]
MTRMWWAQFFVLVQLTQLVTTRPPEFRCQDDFDGIGPNCDGTYEYRDMNKFQIEETTEVNKLLYTLEAFDPDGTAVSYDIVSYTADTNPYEEDGFGYINVDRTTGNVSTKAEIDYEAVHLLWIRWKLTDSTSEETLKSVSVFVKDVNDNDPKFTSERYQLQEAVKEGSMTSNDVIFTVSASDDDSEETIRYDIIEDHQDWPCNGDLFEIDAISGNITLKVNTSLDFEINTQYTICVRASDSGKPSGEPRYDYAQVIVYVQDEQDTAPFFTITNYDREITEDEPLGFGVIRVTARDGDRGVFTPNVIEYSLVGGDDKFEINNGTGQITIKAMLDRETKSSHIVTVTAQEIRADGTPEVQPSSAEVNITFQVGDIDDENATFSSRAERTSLPENSLQGSFVPLNELSVSDTDQAPNNEFKLLLGGADKDTFRIQNENVRGEATVDVRVKNNTLLDFERRQYLDFEIYATNGDGVVYDVARVLVNITDQNDETPTFSQQQYSFEVQENSRGVFVGDVNATDADSEPFSQVTYQLFGLGDNPQFAMDRMTGEITTRPDSSLDFEGQKVYFFTCVATDGERSGTATVQIELTDQNDNAPAFSSETYTAQVDENTIPESSLLSVSATDRDRDNQVSFSLFNDSYSERFEISSAGELKLLQKLDFEEDGPTIKLIVVATDSGSPPQSANATVIVRIQDMNDQSPIFTEKVYDGNVSEDATRGTLVLKVSATDDDQENTVNSRIDYFFVDSVSDFRLSIATGEVTVNSDNLDRDIQGNYSLEVIAIDRGEPARNGTCYVNITLTDVNNKPPIFKDQAPTAEIYENATVNSPVTIVTAVDPDKTAYLSYTIISVAALDEDGNDVSGSFGENFWIDNKTGEVFTGDTLNREVVATFDIKITVEDLNGQQGTDQENQVTLIVNILDINDNAPEFSETNYQFTVTENTAVDTVISTSIGATDKDQGDNAVIRFRLADDVDSLMKIDSTSGTLSVNGTFDREKYPNYTALVVAFDKGYPELSSDATIVIIINDINDNDPEFNTSMNYEAEIPENFKNQTTILQAIATDADGSEKFGSVTYEISAGNPDDIFCVDEFEGDVMICYDKELDREEEEIYRLTVSASDGERIANKQVTIKVLDINDNPPEFTSQPGKLFLQESVDVGQLVTTLTATDVDEPNTNNSKVVYDISAGNSRGLFEITTERGGGVIRTAASLSNEVGVYNLHVVAMDAGMPPLKSEPLFLAIEVTDVNDDTPEIIFPRDLDVFYILENYTGFVLNVTAKDTDSGPNGDVFFRFIDSVGENGLDSKYFDMIQVDNYTVAINIHTVTDRETKEIYELKVEVKDRGPFPLASQISFTVQVNDTDDNEPLFWTDPSNKPAAEFSVLENDGSAVIGSVDFAADADEPQNWHIYYFIVDGNSEEQAKESFKLDKTSGELSLQKPLDREQNQTHMLVVKVTSDEDFIPVAPIPYNEDDNTLLPVTVTVKDENDNGPAFYVEDKLYTGGVKYNAEFESEVIKVEAIDSDVGEYAIVVYKITEQKYTSTDGVVREDNAFAIIERTGSVITNRVFEKGDAGYFTIRVEASDSKNDAFKDEATVSIYIYSEEQQVEMTIFKSTDEVRGYEERFKDVIEEIILKYGVLNSNPSVKRATSAITPAVVIDDIQILVVDDAPKPGWSIMRFHVTNKADNTIIAPSVIVKAIDDAYDYTEIIRTEFGVEDVVIAIPPTEPPPDLTWIQWLLVGILCAVVVFAVGLVATICIMRSGYRRKLRAATAGTYERIIPSSNANHAPNTNQFTEPGSNPLFNKKLSDEFENRYVETPEDAEEAAEDKKKEKMSNGHAKQIADDSISNSEDQEIVVDMFDDSADYEEVPDNETGDKLLMEVLADYDKEKKGQVNLAGFAELTITEI